MDATRTRVWCTLLVILDLSLAECAYAHVSIKRSPQGQVLEISSLASDPGSPCAPTEDSGLVVKRDFEDDAVTLKGIVVEHKDGTRTFINVETPTGLNMAEQGLVLDGLQRLSKIGRQVELGLFACGAAGRFLYLDRIR